MKRKQLQDYLKRKDIVIEGNVSTWNVTTIGNVQGTYTGQFRFKCFLTPTEKLAAGRDYRALIGPNPVGVLENEENIAFSLSQLKYRILKAPPFWSSATGLDGFAGDLPDENVINVVLEAALASEFKYAAMLENRKEDSIKKAKKAAEKIAENAEEDEDEDDSES